MEKKTLVKVPDAYLPLVEDLRLLQSDGDNPNRMTIKQKDQVWSSLQKYGWTYPIITNKDGVFADGEQRAQVCKDHGEYFAPVLRQPVSDVDRRMLRQILNKLKGKHNRELDDAEYMRIVKAGERDCLAALLRSIGEKLPEIDGRAPERSNIMQTAMNQLSNAWMRRSRSVSLRSLRLKDTGSES